MRRGGNPSPPDSAAIARTGLPQRTSTAAHVPQRTAAACGGQCGVCGAARPAGPRFRKPRGCVGGISCAPSGECPFRTAERRTTDTSFGAAGSASGVSASPPPRSHLTWGCIWVYQRYVGAGWHANSRRRACTMGRNRLRRVDTAMSGLPSGYGVGESAAADPGHSPQESPLGGLTIAARARSIMSAEPPSRRAAEPPSRRAAEPPSRRAAGHESVRRRAAPAPGSGLPA